MRTALAIATLLAACTVDYDSGTGGEARYTADAEGMRLFFAERCENCHGYDPGQGQLELPADVADVVVASDPESSILWQRLEAGQMPPGNPIEPELFEHVYEWIASGEVQL